jgi:hypothetical protein
MISEPNTLPIPAPDIEKGTNECGKYVRDSGRLTGSGYTDSGRASTDEFSGGVDVTLNGGRLESTNDHLSLDISSVNGVLNSGSPFS